MEPSGASVYPVSFGDDFIDNLRDYKNEYRTNSKNLDVLRAYTIRVPDNFPLSGSSAGQGLYMYYQAVSIIGQTNVARALLGLFYLIDKKMKSVSGGVLPDRYDDFVRSHLKFISAHSFPKVFTDSPAYMFFCHL